MEHQTLIIYGRIWLQTMADYSLFTKFTTTSFVALFVYVDNIILTSSDIISSYAVKDFLATKFRIQALIPLKYFLGMEVGGSKFEIQICQRKYALDIISETCLLAHKPSSSKMEPNLKLKRNEGDILHDPTLYWRLIGKLLYLTNTRLDLSYCVHLLSQFMNKPRQPHDDAAIKIIKYVKGTLGQGIFFSANSQLQVVA